MMRVQVAGSNTGNHGKGRRTRWVAMLAAALMVAASLVATGSPAAAQADPCRGQISGDCVKAKALYRIGIVWTGQPSTLCNWTVTVNWGDGSTEQVDFTSTGDGNDSLTHRYRRKGVYRVSVSGVGRPGNAQTNSCTFNAFSRTVGVVGRKAQLCSNRLATIVGTNGNNRINGTSGNDVIVGKKGKDIIDGKGGNDIICGNGGKDTLIGGSGTDILIGGSGNDTLRGGAGVDGLFGGPGKDRLFGGASTDFLTGEGGRDLLNGGPGDDSLRGGPGNDRLRGKGGNDNMNGGPGTDSCKGGGGNNTKTACE